MDFVNTYSYDKLNRLTVVDQANTYQAKRVAMSYNALGQRTQLDRYESFGTTPPVATTTYSYDTANRLSRMEHKRGETVFNAHDYVFDNLSRIVSVQSKIGPTDFSGQPRPVNFTYDALSQLQSAEDGTQAHRPGSQAFALTYDQNGNRTGATHSTGVDNRVQTAAGESYVYDREGNVTEVWVDGRISKLFEWDHRNRLTRATVSSSGGNFTSVGYAYDAFNRLIARGGGGVAAIWGYDEGINPLLQVDNNGFVTNRYLWSDRVDELLADEQKPTGSVAFNTVWALADHQGSIKDLLDFNPTTGASAVVDNRQYDAFGNLESPSGVVDVIFGYTGKFLDRFTGLQNNWNRWYSPKLGRFVSQDPIGFAGGDANLYRYAGNEPTNKRDPSGLADWLDWMPPEVKAYPGEVGRVWKGFFWNAPVNAVQGTASAVYNYDDTLAGIQAAVSDPIAAFNAIKQDYYEKASTTEGSGEILFDVTTAILAATKAANVAKLKKLQKLNSKVDIDVPEQPITSTTAPPAPVSGAGLVDDAAELAAQQRLIEMTGNTRNAHYLGKHSPLVSDQALIDRATRGIDPWTGAVRTNRRGQIANLDSTRFNSYQDMLESIQKAQRSFAAQYPGGVGIPSRGGTVTIDMLRDVGVGYAKDTGVFRSGLTRVRVLFDEFGQVISAYPLYR